MKKKFRKIVVDGSTYVWRFSQGYVQMAEGFRCRDIFIAYAEKNHTSPLQIEFDTWEDSVVGGPLRTGLPLDLNDPSTGGINLHTPKWAALLIREGLKYGWQANARLSALEVKEGTDLLLRLQTAVLGETMEKEDKMSVEKIMTAIKQLSPNELEELMLWLNTYRQEIRDKQN